MKNKILNILIEHQNQYISGEHIAETLNVSRVAISKQIKKLRESGYQISSITNKGYCFHNNEDILYKEGIMKNLNPFYYQVDIVNEIDSTNEAIKRISSTIKEGYTFISDSQQNGKGRNGRTFHSPAHQGIYLSFYLTPKLYIMDSLKLTACASVAIFKAIEKNYGITSSIKWVNDIYIDDKKIAGILCEASLEMNTTNLEYMIVGIGVNVHSYQKPKAIETIAASIEDYSEQVISRNQIITDILNYFYELYTELDKNTFLPIYKKYSYVLNKEIAVSQNNQTYNAKVLDINEQANLIIELEDKEKRILNSGEVSIRKIT